MKEVPLSRVRYVAFATVAVVFMSSASAFDEVSSPEPPENGDYSQTDTMNAIDGFPVLLDTLGLAKGASDGEVLRNLRSAPEAVRNNIPALLAEARQATDVPGPDIDEYLRENLSVRKASTGSFILGAVVDSIRQSGNEAERTRALNLVKPFVDEALLGEVPGVSPQAALRSYYHCVFEPSSMALTPGTSPAIEDIVTTLRMSLKQADRATRTDAAVMLTDAAYVLPERREELLGHIASSTGEEQAQECRGYLELRLRIEGEPIPRERLFSEIQAKSDRELADWLVRTGGGGNIGNLYMDELILRLPDSPDRTAIVLRLLSKPEIARFHSGDLFPEPNTEEAGEADKRFIDELIRFLQSEIAKAGDDDSSRHNWAVKALGGLIVSDAAELKETRGAVAAPYARDRVILALLQALGSENRSVQECAATQLRHAVWLGEVPAQAALVGLQAIRDQIEQEHDLSRPDSEFPGHGDWSGRPEKWVHESIMEAIAEAEWALRTFEAYETPAIE